MINTRTEKRLIEFLLWFMAGLVLVIVLTSCSPFSAMATSEPTAAPSKPAQLLTVPSSTATEKSAQLCQVRTGMPSGYLNLRTGAGVSFSVIRILAEGETLQVLKRGAWLHVIDTRGEKGFVNANYCR